MTVESTSRSRTEIFFGGTAAQIQSALHTEIHRFVVNGKNHFANLTEPSIPTAFAGMVLGFRNLDDFRPQSRIRPVPHFTSSMSGDHFLAPGDFATIYDLNPLYSSGFDGTGETIAVVGDSAINVADINAFRSAAGLPQNEPLVMVVPSTGTPAENGDEVEADLDIEWSGAVAKGANVIYVVVGPSAPGGASDALTYAIDNNLAPVISNSFGLCESDATTSGALSTQQSVQQANAQGETVTSAAGDAGVADCDGDLATTPATASLGLAVDVPASIPEVTGVGGTEFTGDAKVTPANGCSPQDLPYWDSSCSPTSGPSALEYIPEMVWNDTAASVALGAGLAAGGGGASTIFAKPTWQTGTGVPADGHRDVPDVSLNASNLHDPYLVCSQAFFSGVTPAVTSCTSGFRASDGESLAAVGGTSVGAPTFAGILAIINQATRAGSPSGQGNANPTLYTLAKSTANPGPFHDITAPGTNSVPCVAGTPSTDPKPLQCPQSGQFGVYNAGTGYDQASGLGSVDANVMVRAWPNFSITPDFSVGATALNLSSPGQSGSSTITVEATNGFSGTVNLSSTPCPSTAFITCTLSATSVTVNGSTATATLNVVTSAPHALAGAFTQLRRPAGLGWFTASGGTLLAGFFAIGVPSRRKWWTKGWSGLLGLLFLILAAAGISCGGGSSSTSHQLTGGTPAGNYTVTITAAGSSGGPSHTTNVTVTVQ